LLKLDYRTLLREFGWSLEFAGPSTQPDCHEEALPSVRGRYDDRCRGSTAVSDYWFARFRG